MNTIPKILNYQRMWIMLKLIVHTSMYHFLVNEEVGHHALVNELVASKEFINRFGTQYKLGHEVEPKKESEVGRKSDY